MIRKQNEREPEGKDRTAFRLRGREVNPDKIKRYIREHPRHSVAYEDPGVGMTAISAGMLPLQLQNSSSHLIHP